MCSGPDVPISLLRRVRKKYWPCAAEEQGDEASERIVPLPRSWCQPCATLQTNAMELAEAYTRRVPRLKASDYCSSTATLGYCVATIECSACTLQALVVASLSGLSGFAD